MSLHFVDKVFSFMLYYNWDNMCVRSAGCELKDDRDARIFCSHHNGLWRGKSGEVAVTINRWTKLLTVVYFSLSFSFGWNVLNWFII